MAICSSTYAQLRNNEQPVCLRLSIKQLNDISELLISFIMPVLDMSKIGEEEVENEEKCASPLRSSLKIEKTHCKF